MTNELYGHDSALPVSGPRPRPVLLRRHEGLARLWGRGSEVTTKLTMEDTRGALGMTHFRAVHGERSPRHIHTREDEIFLIASGTATVSVGERTEVMDSGGVLYLPRGIPHSYHVESDTAEFYVLTLPGGFERFFMTAGYPLENPEAALVGDRWSPARARETAEGLGLGVIWCE